MADAQYNFDVTVVGSCNVDLISYVPVFPRAGETINGKKFAVGCGGKSANSCVMAAKLGAKSAMIGRLGDDTFGHMYLKNFSKHRINVDFLKTTQDVATGVAPIFVNDEGENAIVVVKGANDLLTKEDLKAAQTVIQNSRVVICQLEINPEITMEALRIAKSHGVTTIFNPAPAIHGLSKDFLTHSDIVICNETEAEVLTGMPVNSESDYQNAILKLIDHGCHRVVITLGSKGAICASADDRTPFFVNAKEAKAIDTTGAGDAFVGSMAFFIATYGESLPFYKVVEKASYIAAVTVTKVGTQTSYPDRHELPSEIFEVNASHIY